MYKHTEPRPRGDRCKEPCDIIWSPHSNQPGSQAPGDQAKGLPGGSCLVLGLLFLSPVVEAAVAMRRCSSSYTQLLSQLQSQAYLMKDTGCLLEPYIRLQGLNTPILRRSCMECSDSAFPSKDALGALSRHAFLHSVSATLGSVLQGLHALQQKCLKAKDLPELHMAIENIRGIRNNIYCMSELFTKGSEMKTPEAPRPSTEAPLTPSAQDTFQAKMEGCQFLCGYHSFMGSVEQIFRKWGDSSSRNRRHSSRRALHKGARRARPSGRVRRPVSMGQLSW
ncbi:oncostatin-M isoform X1 [Octodon degus]|uniref:Oncostatin-M isoform X1 n=1 Tax=Octodon degus TaxID=10160 RepID=A0A6P6DNU5_OCTDE|nr:oncostatin-M isoform X1 [Octodon degus]